MSRSLLSDAFEHHAWATLRLIDACLTLTLQQLAATAPGTYGSIIDTMQHLVAGDASYLWVLVGGEQPSDGDAADLVALRDLMERNRPRWAALLEGGVDPDRVVVRHRDDGSETRTPLGIRLAQVIHHGTDHRSHVATILTTLGIEPPEIDVWAFAVATGQFEETEPTERIESSA